MPASESLTHTDNAPLYDDNPFQLRADQLFIASLIDQKAKILEVGCSNGQLLEHLRHYNTAHCFGLEVNAHDVQVCLRKGFSIVQGNADDELVHYPSDSFDVVILSHTLQHMQNPGKVLQNLMRIGKAAVVSFHNFGHWQVPWHLIRYGRMPQIGSVPVAWHQIHGPRLFTLRDFTDYCHESGYTARMIRMLNANNTTINKPLRHHGSVGWLVNLLCQSAVVKLERQQ